MTDYASILRGIGYKLIDRGHYWQTSALYRHGDNESSISIFKDSGVWTDFVEQSKPMPFEVLLKKTLKTNDVGHILKNEKFNFTVKQRELLKQEKTYPEESLKRLLPDYDFFTNRGISVETLQAYRGGLATSGKLYQRFVFPIYRADGKIHGFHGRKVLEDNDRPKWLPYGRNTDWLYPYFSVEGVSEQIEEEKRIFVVESIGDSLALYDEGVKNNIVSFTNLVTPKLAAKLISFDCDIVLCFNNDEGQNRGFDGVLSSVLKMIDLCDLDRIWFFPPPSGDFGDMRQNEPGSIRKWRESLNFSKEAHKESIQRLIEYAPKAKIAKSLRPKIRKLKKQFEFLYE